VGVGARGGRFLNYRIELMKFDFSFAMKRTEEKENIR